MSNDLKNSSRDVHVVMATDDNYAHHLSVVVASMLTNLGPERRLVLHVLFDELSDSIRDRLRQLNDIREFDLNFIQHDLSHYSGLRSTWSAYTSRLTYARLNLGSILPDLQKCVYLDCDVVVRHDIAELYDRDISDYYFGAVEEIEEIRIFRNQDLGMPVDTAYFNAGVLLLNLDAMREHSFYERTLEFLEQHKTSLHFGDQDALNALFYGKWMVLPMRWNVIAGMCLMGLSTRYLHYDPDHVRQALGDPAIVHFTQKEKPDSYLCVHPFAKEYWHYLAMTPWKDDVVLKDRSVKNQIRRILQLARASLRRTALFQGLRDVKRRLGGYGK